jgi:predicted nucleic acid-binding protein
MRLLLDTNTCIEILRGKNAATALAHGLTVITHNTREFGCIDDLIVEDWRG